MTENRAINLTYIDCVENNVPMHSQHFILNFHLYESFYLLIQPLKLRVEKIFVWNLWKGMKEKITRKKVRGKKRRNLTMV